ncbi:DUF721 domain-containing protein [Solidesulfovibrio sp.]|uniref:DUF721 domain-containing protein n=1 Tax=Solidesulfovibrio sp. TaxID=2910990 RepID=UPI0026059860|nr:DUF721 domain-containing protein [Solidesulfovibrio sp.]
MLRRLSESIDRFVSGKEAAARHDFVAVCRRWAEIVGPETAELVRPLGHRRRDLLLGADDPVVMQEMHFAAPEILSLVNAALGHEAFDRVRFDLLGDQVSLDALRAAPPRFSTPPAKRPENLGGQLGRFDPATPVGRCYAKYVAYFEAGPQPSGKVRRGGRKKAG